VIGKIERLPLREVWKNEARDFTTWLVENTDVLSDVIGITLQDAKREHAAGDFNVDLVAEDDGGNAVVIENQLEKRSRPSRKGNNLRRFAWREDRNLDCFRPAARAYQSDNLAQ